MIVYRVERYDAPDLEILGTFSTLDLAMDCYIKAPNLGEIVIIEVEIDSDEEIKVRKLVKGYWKEIEPPIPASITVSRNRDKVQIDIRAYTQTSRSSVLSPAQAKNLAALLVHNAQQVEDDTTTSQD